MNTNWTQPKRHFFAGLTDLRNALASGSNARLVRARNEDCMHPIRVENQHSDFRCYDFHIGHPSTRQKIESDPNMSDFEKHLSLNYISCYGTKEAVDTYYETGVVSADNFKGIGRNHLVKATDKIQYLIDTNIDGRNNETIHLYSRQYCEGNHAVNHMFDFYHLKKGFDQWSTKKFKRKLWVVELLKDNEPKAKVPFLLKVLNTLAYPLKYVPQKSVLDMDEYKNITYRIGGITNGFAVEFQIPKKFSFS